MDIWNDLTDAFNKDMAVSEMAKKYNDTLLLIEKTDGSELLAWYKGFNEGYHWFKDELGTNLRLRHETSSKVTCRFPERCLFNHDHMALEFIRKPNRQNRRGICKDNVSIYSPISRIWHSDPYPWTIATIRDALYPQYPSCCEEAIKRLDSGDMCSIALNQKFMISKSFTKTPNEYYLFYSSVVIGCYIGGTFHIKHSLFTQEVMDNLQLFTPFRVEF